MAEVLTPCVIAEAKITFDTRPGRDVEKGELVYLYSIKPNGIWFEYHLISLAKNKPYCLRFSSKKYTNWFQILS